MRKIPEGGGLGTAQSRAYTYWFLCALHITFWCWLGYDLQSGGRQVFRTAMGVESWVVICILAFIGLGLARGLAAGAVGYTYTQFTGLYYTEDRIGYAKAGGTDIATWIGMACYIGSLCLFSFWVPSGFAGGLRPLLVIGAAIFSSCALARLLALFTFKALFGPRSYSVRRTRHR